MIASIFSDVVSIRRRSSNPSLDVLNNPVYGEESTWPYAYQNIRCRLAYSGKQMKISSTGELIFPQGQGYVSKDIILKPMDRIFIVKSAGISSNIEYVCEAVWPAYLMSNVLDHYEFSFALPIV